MYFEQSWIGYEFCLEDGEPLYDPTEEDPVVVDQEYCCPECDAVLFRAESEAIKFLKGESVEEKIP